MCWPHVYRNVVPRLGQIKKKNLDIGNSIMSDIEDLQWSCSNEATFRIAYDLLENKYLEKEVDDDLLSSIKGEHWWRTIFYIIIKL